MSEGNGNGRARIRFDPTINLGHIMTAGFTLATVVCTENVIHVD